MTAEPDDYSDGELAALALAGRQSAYRGLMDRYRGPVYRLIRSAINDADEAVDLTQDTFIAAFGALGSFDCTRAFRPWISRIALNKCRDWGRRRAVRRLFAFAQPLEAAAKLCDQSIPVDQAVADREDLTRVSTAIAALPRAIREPLILHTVEGLSQAQTASVLRISEKAVETRVRRAREQLAAILRD